MVYYINNLDSHVIQDARGYFFDANVWLYLLNPKNKPTHKEEKYIDFFETVTQHHKKTHIIVTAILLSEIINRYLREVGQKKYAQSDSNIKSDKDGNLILPPRYFKDIYRKSQQYSIDYGVLTDDIKIRHSCLTFVNDGFGTVFSSKDILKNPPTDLDFNDHLMVKLARENKFIIVTNDKDFFVEDIEILTLNQDLLDKRPSPATPKGQDAHTSTKPSNTQSGPDPKPSPSK